MIWGRGLVGVLGTGFLSLVLLGAVIWLLLVCFYKAWCSSLGNDGFVREDRS